MRCATPHPCIGSRERVLSTIISRVPCTSSPGSPAIVPSPSDHLKVRQDDGAKGWIGWLGVRLLTNHFTPDARPPRRSGGSAEIRQATPQLVACASGAGARPSC